VFDILCKLEEWVTSWGTTTKHPNPRRRKMELQKILPDFIKEVVKQTLESIMVAEREVFLKENGGTSSI